ncbi:MAG: UvrD-helicase domain-containing protein [Flavobacteriaceae bacterium]
MESEFKVYSASAGSGKTFTLVKEYLKIILNNSEDYAFQSILAITFTNKAAAEMKERVLHALEEFAEVDLTKKWPDLFQLIETETKLPPQKIKSKSHRVLNLIMQNYASLSITTIDSFTHRLIRTFAFDLGIPMNFEIEMDGKKLISEAVDLLLDKLGRNKEITDALKRFVRDKIDQDSDWNISRDLNDIAQILLNEVDASEFRNYEHQSLDKFISLEQGILAKERGIRKSIEEPAKKALKLIQDTGIQAKTFSRGTLYKYFEKASHLPSASNLEKTACLESLVSGKSPCPKSVDPSQKALVEQITPELQQFAAELLNELPKAVIRYKLYKNLRKELIPLAVLNQIAKLLEGLKDDSNLKFIAEFNRIISDSIVGQPAPFIYERLGERYKYFFIDEMQDTSELQWKNLIPLLHNALSSEDAMVMLVGDGKQSIYRFRGGKAEQFIDLSSPMGTAVFHVDKNLYNLDTNYRSYSEVINFNNALFSYLSNRLDYPEYKAMYLNQNNQLTTHKKGGYVSVSLVDEEDNDQALLDQIVQVIEHRDLAYKLGDICILVRTGSDGVKVADYLSSLGYEIVSSETLRLTNSPKINFIIDILSSLINKSDRQVWMRMVNFFMPDSIENEDLFFERFAKDNYYEFEAELKDYGFGFDSKYYESLPFYDGIEYLIRVFKLNDESDAYLQFFLDFVFEYQSKNFAHISDFLSFWELKKDRLSIVAPKNDYAISIMTVHKSKGLEFPFVISAFSHRTSILPQTKIWASMPEESLFEDFPRLRIPPFTSSEGLSEQVDQEILDFKEGVELDNLNLLYVAFTRAAEQLHVLMQKPKGPQKNTFEFLEGFLGAQVYKMHEENGLFYSGDPNRPETSLQKGAERITHQGPMISTPWEDHDIHVLQEGSKYWDSDQGKAIDFGNKVHEIMADIISAADQEYAVDKALLAGLINPEEAIEISAYIKNICEHKELKEYFSQGKRILNERSMMANDGTIFIPDRLVFEGEKVTIIDYKTGDKSLKYRDQIDGYAYVLAQMGYAVDKKILIYASDPLEVEVY